MWRGVCVVLTDPRAWCSRIITFGGLEGFKPGT